MPARLLPFAALLVTTLLASVSAQVPVHYAVAHLAPADTAPALGVYAGRYATDGGAVEVVLRAGALRVIAHGAPVAAALAPSPVDARAAGVAAAWAADDLGPALAAVAPGDRETARADLAASRAALVRARGAVRSARPAGTFRRTDGRRVTLVEVTFARGAEWLSLVWAADGALSTVTRGLGAADLGAARPAGPDAFTLGERTLRFARGADGRVSGLTVDGRVVAER